MKTKLCKVLSALATAAMLLCLSACGSGGQVSSAPEGTVEPEASQTGVQTAEPEESEAVEQGMDIEQYKAMAEKFTMYCEYVYFDYQGRGTVTINDVRVEEDTESQCRITVYYREPELSSDNSHVDATDGYMGFVIDKATSLGTMEFWNYLGVPGEYLDEPVDQMTEAIYYSYGVYSMDDDYDFQAGTILSSGVVVADVIGYFD